MTTLMIVDDEEGPRLTLEMLFKDDYTIRLAESGRKAIELVRLETIEAAIVDLRMPEMSGIETLSALKKIDPAIEVIILTAYETLETARQALRLGACDYLTKPFDIATIRHAVAMAMERRQRSEKLQGFHHKLLQLQEEIQNRSLREEMARTRGQIFESVIHDLNNPLTVILASVDIINHSIRDAHRIEGESLEALKEQLYRVTLHLSNCYNVSRRYRELLRAQPGDAEASVRVNQTLSDLNGLLKSHSAAKMNDLVIEPLTDDLSARIHGIDLLQILLNLATNALQSSSARHRVEVHGRLLLDPLDLTKCSNGPADRYVNLEGFLNAAPLVALTVRDEGRGIQPETIGSVFDPYFSTKPPSQGSGLGLSIVKRLVEQAKGAIHLHTQLGQGTSVTVYLRAMEGAADVSTR